MQHSLKPLTSADRSELYFRYKVFQGCVLRWGKSWHESPVHLDRIYEELEVIEQGDPNAPDEPGYQSFFLILHQILAWCDTEKIIVGPGRGSVGGSAVCYALKIHDIDPLERDLLFERFLNPDRVELPDIDIDLSQRDRPRVLQHVRDTYGHLYDVLQVAAFSRLGGRSNVDAVAAGRRSVEMSAAEIAAQLKTYLPKGNITMGTKQPRELEWWLDTGNKVHGEREKFRSMAENVGWMPALMKLDGLPQNLAKHAAGVVLLNPADSDRMPKTGIRGAGGTWTQMTAFDMYALGSLKVLKWDFLGLRTLDVIVEADQLSGGPGSRDHLIQLWRDHQNDPAPYELLSRADTLGIFQMETDGYRRTLRDFQPDCFDHIVHLNALYRPGALDAHEFVGGRNMVQIYIDRLHNREPAHTGALSPEIYEILKRTQGIILFQEQAMELAKTIAGFSRGAADNLRKAIAKKQLKLMAGIKPSFIEGCQRVSGLDDVTADKLWDNISAAARYSWNKSHSEEYGLITWLTAWFKSRPDQAPFYCALINSWDEDKERQAEVIAEARQDTKVSPPDVNLAELNFTVSDGAIVFGLNGIKGMGDSYKKMLQQARLVSGGFFSFEDFCKWLPSFPMNLKKALLACGAFESLGEDRSYLLATVSVDSKGKAITVADLVNKNTKLKKPRPLPPPWEVAMLDDRALAAMEMETIGFYISTDPMKRVNRMLACLPRNGTYFGGEVEKIQRKTDKRGGKMAMFTILTPSMASKRVVLFASKMPQNEHFLEKGTQILIRGKEDGGSILVDGIFEPGDFRQFQKLSLTRDEKTDVSTVPAGSITEESIDQWRSAGYRVEIA